MILERVERSIKNHEGFSPKPYPDPLTGGEPFTFGYGFTRISRAEAEVVLHHKIRNIATRLTQSLKGFEKLPDNVQEVLIEMAYQIGVSGMMKFKRMLKAIDEWDFVEAAKEIENSKLCSQTPERCRDYVRRMKGE